MSKDKNITGNGVQHVSSCCAPSSWPPAWLTESAAETSKATTPAPACGPAVSTLPNDDSDEITLPPPCPCCGSLDLWETITGEWRCQHCDGAALRRSRNLLERATRLRRLSKRNNENETPDSIRVEA
jgi:hypothetical protein